MNLTRITLVLTLLLLVAGSLNAAGFALSGVGSRAISMGGAFRAMADDGTAMFWNPAGLAFVNETNISLAGSFFLPAAKWENNAVYPGFALQEYESEKSLRMFPSVFMTEENQARWKWGFSVFVPYGLGATWNAYSLPTHWPDGTPVVYVDGFPEKEMMSSIAIIDAHPTFAYMITPDLSVGVGASLMYGMIDILKTAPPAPESPLAATSYYSPTTFDLSGSGIGIGANFGLLYKPLPMLSVGLSGRTASKLSMKGDADVNLWLNQLVNFSVTGNFAPAVYGTNGNRTDITADLPLPAEIGGGVSFNVMPNWAVNLDYAYTLWSRLDKVTVELDSLYILGNHVESQDLVFNWKDTSRISIGTEYKLNCSRIRAGFFWEESPIPDETMSPTFPDINTKMSFNLGYGRSFGRWTLDANGQYVIFDERQITTPTRNNMTGTYNSSVISGNLGIGYRF